VVSADNTVNKVGSVSYVSASDKKVLLLKVSALKAGTDVMILKSFL
jgi:hypothetical protein